MKRPSIILIGLFAITLTGIRSNAQTNSASYLHDEVKINKPICTPSRQRVVNGVYTCAEVTPEFPGGISKFETYIIKNLRYPKEANGATGRVILTFIVNTDGSLSEMKVLRGISPALDNEAVRVMKSSPKWVPGKEKGKAVRVRYTIPIKFDSPN